MIQVVAALITRDDKVLVCQRTRHQRFPLKWEFPGGKIDPGETPEAALVRELDEELGIRAQIGPLVTTIQHVYAGGGAVELKFFAVTKYEGEIQNRIFREVHWAGREDLPGYDFLDADIGLVQQLATGKIALISR